MKVKQLFVVACGSLLFGAAPALAQNAGPTDPQIAAIVVAANQADIDAAKVAKSRTKNKDVKEFAETMVRDHEAVNKQAKALVKKLKVKPVVAEKKGRFPYFCRYHIAMKGTLIVQ